MRVITGTARGRKLKTLESLDIRPTTDMVKEAIFSAIQFDIEGASVLDLFSGSGQLGIEALSRGARFVSFVDANRRAVEVIKENLITTEMKNNYSVLNMDSFDFLKTTNNVFDIALLDPPYSQDILEKALTMLDCKMSSGGKIICEHEKGLKLPEKIGSLILKKRYKYGKIEVSLYIKPSVE